MSDLLISSLETAVCLSPGHWGRLGPTASVLTESWAGGRIMTLGHRWRHRAKDPRPPWRRASLWTWARKQGPSSEPPVYVASLPHQARQAYRQHAEVWKERAVSASEQLRLLHKTPWWSDTIMTDSKTGGRWASTHNHTRTKHLRNWPLAPSTSITRKGLAIPCNLSLK